MLPRQEDSAVSISGYNRSCNRFCSSSTSTDERHRRKRKRQRQSQKDPTGWRPISSKTLFFLSIGLFSFLTETDAFLPALSRASVFDRPSTAPTVNFHHSTHQRQRKSTELSMVETLATNGLSRYFQAILSRTRDRQRFVTGKYPVIVSVEENPTQKWLNKDSATSLLLVNDTTIDKSLASYDRFQWLDDDERQALHDRYASLSIELLAEIYMPKPGYVQVLPSSGAGSSAELLRELGATTKWSRWKNSTLYQELMVDDILRQQKHGNAWKYVLPSQDRLWVTGFSIAGRKGIVKSVDVNNGFIESVNDRSQAMTLWPNEVSAIPKNLFSLSTTQQIASITEPAIEHHNDKLHHDKSDHSLHQTPQQLRTLSVDTYAKEAPPRVFSWMDRYEDALLVSDGFLVPGKDRGGIYVIQNPGNPNSEWTISLTDRDQDSWFYHRAVWVDLTGDGRKSILTARAKLRKVGKTKQTQQYWKQSSIPEESTRPKNGQLVWLEMPKPHRYDEATGTPLEEDGTEFDPFDARHLPWKEHVLARGPDVMFSVADLDTTDDTIEIISSQFFDKKVTLHSIQRGPEPKIVFTKIIDDRCGAAFGGILADLEGRSITGLSPNRQVLDSGSTVPSLQPGDSFSHILVTSHECNYASEPMKDEWSSVGMPAKDHTETTIGVSDGSTQQVSIDGGSLFSYRVPEGKGAWKTEPWIRTTIATGFKVKGQLWNVINPGAPGFVYTFHAKAEDAKTTKRPMIAVAGDCAESAYLFRPEKYSKDHASNAQHHSSSSLALSDPAARYKLMCEIQCGATVGSIGVGYDNLCSVEQESGYAKLYIPCYEKDKVLVFAMGSGEGDDEDDGGWGSGKSQSI